jgi:natural product biosynthesis luciferase-like monooxygenase protein
MRFGLFYEMQGASGRSDRTLYEEHLREFEVADAAGYDCLWLAELHFNRDYSILPAPLLLGAAAAQRTKRIRIGSGVAVLPINNPLRLAEEIATLDILSGGRVDFGVGRGHPMTGIYDHFEIDIEQSKALFREHLQIVRKAWSEERFSFKGKFHDLEDVAVVPKPVQSPVPTFVSAFSPDTFELAAEFGLHLFLAGQVTPPPVLAQAIQGFRATLQKHGRDPKDHRMPVLLPVFVDTDGARARRTFEAPLMSYYAVIGRMMMGMMETLQRRHAEFPPSYQGYLQLGSVLGDLSYEKVCRELAIVGTPQEAVERIAALKEGMGVEEMIIWTNVGALDHDRVVASLALFAEQVMPKV